MARLYTDGAETQDFSLPRTYGYHLVGNSAIETTVVRSGNASYRMTNGQIKLYTWMLRETRPEELYVRFAMRYESDNGVVFSMLDQANGWSLRLQASNGTVDLYTANVYRSGFLATTQTWYLYEVYLYCHDTVGRAVVKLDGVEVADYTGDTKQGSYNTIDSINFQGGNSWRVDYFDDIAINDTSGSDQNSWCGDGQVIILVPNAAGDVAGWTPLSGSNWQNVDEIPHTSDTDYNYTSGSGNYDLFNLVGSGLSGVDIKVVQPVIVGRETVATGEVVDTGIKTGGSEFWDLYNHPFMLSHKAFLGKPYYSNPLGGAWTVSDMDALQVGYKAK